MTARLLRPEFLYREGRIERDAVLGIDSAGNVCSPEALPPETPVENLPGRVLLPGLVNAHSHAFQRLLRGRTEFLAPGRAADDFWSWRERMYQVATALGPEELYVASRHAFVEMALAGITTVGEFHYLHHTPDGTPYADPNELALQVIRAARDVGLRIALLRVGYARAGFQVAPNPRQRRFYDASPEAFFSAAKTLAARTVDDAQVSVGLAPHSVRAVPREWLEAVVQEKPRIVHMHVAEQLAEIEACQAEHGLRPVEFLAELGMLSPRFTAVHGVHLTDAEVAQLGAAKAHVCACPSTEKNLGDGVVPGDALRRAGVRISLGSDSQAEIDLLSEARQLEGHLRLFRQRRAVLDTGTDGSEGLARTLLHAATVAGASTLGLNVGTLSRGTPADFFTVDLKHPTLAGWDGAQVLSAVVWGASAATVREVAVQGRFLVRDGEHVLQQSSSEALTALARKVLG